MEVGVVAGGGGSWEDLTLPNRCLVDLGEPEKDELLAMGKEESGRGGEDKSVSSIPACFSESFFPPRSQGL